jgi:L-ascorbate metabolism protein UlaG (beta-lactamase superfamily)
MNNQNRQNGHLRIVRLSWAGVQITAEDTTLVIDPFENAAPLRSLVGDPIGEMVACPDELDAALITHLHLDHYDKLTLERRLKPGAPVLCHPANARAIAADGFLARAMVIDQQVKIGPFVVTALPAVDGLGDPQISFMVEFGQTKVLHCGDTLWHGNWWKLRERYGPVDVAFLPINGVVIEFPGMKPSGFPVDLTPAQAAAAADILGAKIVCPMHYKAFHHPPAYAEWPGAEQAFLAAAAKRGVKAKVLEPGEDLSFLEKESVTSDLAVAKS